MARKSLFTLPVYVEQRFDGNQSEAARHLGITRGTLRRLLEGQGTSVDVALTIWRNSEGCVDWTTLGNEPQPVTPRGQKGPDHDRPKRRRR